MKAKEYLNNYQTAGVKLMQAEDEIRRIEATLTVPGPKIDGMPRASEKQNQVERDVLRLIEQKEKYIKMRDDCERMRANIIATIHETNDATSIALLYQRYIILEPRTLRKRSWLEIADDMGYNADYLSTDAHDKAIEQVQAILDKTSVNLGKPR